MDYLISKKTEKDKQMYLVKWTGKQHHYNTWAPVERILKQANGSALLKNYEDNLGEQIARRAQRGRKKESQKSKKRSISIEKLKIMIPCLNKQRTNWIFGDRVKQVLLRDHLNKKYKVKWENGEQTFEDEQQLIQKQPRAMCLFFERELKLKN